MNIASTLATSVLFAALTPVALAAPAHANDDDVIRRGQCSGSATWKLKASPEDGRIEVEAEIDTNRNGRLWRWRLLHNGSLTASGTKYTQAPSGSFEVRRVVVNLAGTDHLTFRARNPRTGQLCVARLAF
jgi:hypothetical protein